ncbi:mechanosensitive ion channel family protein [Oxyplasma meridianum]|uniref:Mechanosensitive ion channel family protein n=1 Tax=Oxyplasma meridianum TaxID=3073602 RepID=A0AAX4NJA5_9ARCH
MAHRKKGNLALKILGLILLMAAVLFLIYLLTVFHVLPVNFTIYVNAIFIGIIVYVILRIILSFLNRYLSKYMDKRKIHPIMFLLSILAYFILGVVVLSSLGIDVSSLILGGSLISVVLGLAANTVLSNQFAGILFVVVRPFNIGDLVTMNMWQYGGVFPTLFPKYFSVDRIEATAYTGQVVDITINYTILDMANGDRVKIPNGILVQGAIIIRKPGVLVKARYEIPKFIEFERVEPLIRKEIESIPDYMGSISITVDETTLNTYILMVVAKFNVLDVDEKRGEIFLRLMRLVEPMKSVN